MPQAPRILVEGGLYHIYNRFSRGEEIFSDPEEAIEFLDFSGHRELLGKVRDPLIDVDDALLTFGKTTKNARRTYLRKLNAALAAEERTEVSERLPWWTPERELRPGIGRAYVDELGRSTGRERRLLEAEEFVELACAELGTTIDVLASSRKDQKTTRLHQRVATLGSEQWDQRAALLGGLLGKHPDVVSRWARTGAEKRSKDVEFSDALDQLDRLLVRTPPTPANDL